MAVTLRSVRSTNTTAGMMTYTVAVLCKSSKVSGVRATMEECGLDTFETAFVSIEDNKKGIMYACMHAHCQRVIRTHMTIMIAHVQVVHMYIIVMLYFTFPMQLYLVAPYTTQSLHWF